MTKRIKISLIVFALLLALGLLVGVLERFPGEDQLTKVLRGDVPKSWIKDMVLSVAVDDAGRTALKVTEPGLLEVVDLERKAVRESTKLPNGSVIALAVDPSGKRYALGQADVGVVVRAVGNGAERLTFPNPASGPSQYVNAIAMAPGGFPLVFGVCGRGVYLIRNSTARVEVLREPDPCRSERDETFSVAINRDGALAAAGWGNGNGRWGPEPVDPGKQPASKFAWFTTQAVPYPAAQVWDLSDRAALGAIPGNNAADVDFDSTGRRLLTCDEGYPNPWLWDVHTHRAIWRSDSDSGSVAQFIRSSTLIVIVRNGISKGYLSVVVAADGRQIFSDVLGPKVFTAGHFAARNSDKFLVAHRTGVVDVYQVSADGKTITKYWEF